MKIIIPLLILLTSIGAMADNLDIQIATLKAQIQQLQNMGGQVPETLIDLLKDLEGSQNQQANSIIFENHFVTSGNRQMVGCSEFHNQQLLAHCYNANNLYQEYLRLASSGTDEGTLNQVYQQHVYAADLTIELDRATRN